ncbi:glycoside hydrolase family 19 protein [Shewanella khirikhana]|uniref:GlcNAc-binding protein A n=1 Tax=Shewanella khirikhana TaxID=1965282 RepID=A0ABM7CZ40_9GAMM|nr:glycoside hydrolase family 19 protein [Shewanella khirikhana]AZQ09375.1 GlcNAc-binding protein A [Shewanella khirikhana]
MNKLSILAGAMGALLTASLYAADLYDINKAYGGGSQVSFNGKLYEAKWYANPGQSPGNSYPNEWDNPWSLVGDDPGDTGGASGGTDSGGGTENGGGTESGGAGGSGGANADGTVTMTAAEVAAKEASLTDFPLMHAVKASIATRDNAIVEAVLPGRAENPANVKRLEAILPEAEFEFIFPVRAPEYSYRGLLQAAAKFPALCGDYDDGRNAEAICRKSLATMFAHFAQETGAHDVWRPEPEWRQGLYWVREVGWDETKRGGYNAECSPGTWQGQEWPCGTFANGEYKSYFGRGAKQLSYNYNYGPFSEAMFGTVRTLLDSPELVADSWLNLASAVFFFSYPQPPKPSMLHVIDGTWQPNAQDLAANLTPGFGVTTMIINGGIECGQGTEKPQSANRIEYYRAHAANLGVPVADSEVLGCKDMKAFAVGGSGAMNIYWEQDWSYVPGNPNGGKSYACKLVGYQTRFSAFRDGDYGRCLSHFFPELVIEAGDGSGGGGDNGGGNNGGGEPANQPPLAKISGPSEADSGASVQLSAKQSSDPEGKALSFAWSLPAGVTADSVDGALITLSLPEVSADTSLNIGVTVADPEGASHSVSHGLLLKAGTGETPAYPGYQPGANYQAGSRVSNQGKNYECKPYPYSGWCSGSAWAYEPGVGAYWSDAWQAL